MDELVATNSNYFQMYQKPQSEKDQIYRVDLEEPTFSLGNEEEPNTPAAKKRKTVNSTDENDKAISGEQPRKSPPNFPNSIESILQGIYFFISLFNYFFLV